MGSPAVDPRNNQQERLGWSKMRSTRPARAAGGRSSREVEAASTSRMGDVAPRQRPRTQAGARDVQGYSTDVVESSSASPWLLIQRHVFGALPFPCLHGRSEGNRAKPPSLTLCDTACTANRRSWLDETEVGSNPRRVGHARVWVPKL